MIAIVDYGLGNVMAFYNVYKRLNILAKIVNKAHDLDDADRIILPGVGAFDHAMTLLNGSGMRSKLDDLVINKKIPVLGVCVGMQILACSSTEGKLPGLGWLEGEVSKFELPPGNTTMRIPHMGWNNIIPYRSEGLMQGLSDDSMFYFLHSYYFKCRSSENILATSDYEGKFTCAVASENIYGVQFHPEKSHGWGSQLLDNFSKV
jgi:glutamine amidotransferase